MTLVRKPRMRQRASNFRLAQSLRGKAMRPGSACGFVAQSHVGKPTLVNHGIGENLDPVNLAHEAGYRGGWPAFTIMLNQHHAGRLDMPLASLQERSTSFGSRRMNQEGSK